MPEPSVLTAKDAISRHVRWKMTLQLAIATREPLSSEQVEQICHYRRCPIGRWLDSSYARLNRTHPEFTNLYARHVQFHEEMSLIARLLDERRFEAAASATRLRSDFDRASEALATAITAWDRLSPLAIPL